MSKLSKVCVALFASTLVFAGVGSANAKHVNKSHSCAVTAIPTPSHTPKKVLGKKAIAKKAKKSAKKAKWVAKHCVAPTPTPTPSS